jgi:hypothetical protein
VPQLERVIPGYRRRLRELPGLTGLAQVNLPPDSDLDSDAASLPMICTTLSSAACGSISAFWPPPFANWSCPAECRSACWASPHRPRRTTLTFDR